MAEATALQVAATPLCSSAVVDAVRRAYGRISIVVHWLGTPISIFNHFERNYIQSSVQEEVGLPCSAMLGRSSRCLAGIAGRLGLSGGRFTVKQGLEVAEIRPWGTQNRFELHSGYTAPAHYPQSSVSHIHSPTAPLVPAGPSTARGCARAHAGTSPSWTLLWWLPPVRPKASVDGLLAQARNPA